MKINRIFIASIFIAIFAIFILLNYFSDNPTISYKKLETAKDLAASPAIQNKENSSTAASSNTIVSPPSRASKQLDELLSSVSIDDKFHAYQLIQKCVSARDSAKLLSTVPVGHEGAQTNDRYAAVQKNIRLACEGITEINVRDRLNYLKEAAMARVPGAAAEFWKAGPFGDPTALSSRLDDPLVQSWLTESLRLLQESAYVRDVASLSTLSHLYQTGEYVAANKVTALAYENAALEITRSAGGLTIGRERLVKILEFGLSPEEKTASQKIKEKVLGN